MRFRSNQFKEHNLLNKTKFNLSLCSKMGFAQLKASLPKKSVLRQICDKNTTPSWKLRLFLFWFRNWLLPNFQLFNSNYAYFVKSVLKIQKYYLLVKLMLYVKLCWKVKLKFKCLLPKKLFCLNLRKEYISLLKIFFSPSLCRKLGFAKFKASLAKKTRLAIN